MADKIQVAVNTMPTGTTITSQVYIDKYDQLLVHVPAVTGVMGSAPVYMTLWGAPNTSVTPQIAKYYDYVGSTPKTCFVTVASAGIYEMPYPGAMNYIQVQFDVATTNVTNTYFMSPKTTY